MELETQLPLADRDARKVIENNFIKIQDAISQLQTETADLKKNDSRAEYITDTNINTDHTIDAPKSVVVNENTGNDELSSLMIEEQKGEN